MTEPHHVRRMAVFTLVSWLGEYVHNVVDLPQLTLLSSENSVPALISFGLFIAWWRSPYKRAAGAGLLAWTFFAQFLGGIVSILPLDFLPFDPPQTAPLHYAMHTMYATAQLPLIVALIKHNREQTHENRQRKMAA